MIPASDEIVTEAEGLASSGRSAHEIDSVETEYKRSGGDGLSPHAQKRENNKTPGVKSVTPIEKSKR